MNKIRTNIEFEYNHRIMNSHMDVPQSEIKRIRTNAINGSMSNAFYRFYCKIHLSIIHNCDPIMNKKTMPMCELY